jgi:N-acetylglucosaminyl-diphospho-decaprenol L-rhamnosyltransferase
VKSPTAVSNAGRGSIAYSAIVLYYKLGPELADTIDALVDQSAPPERIVVVDNNSEDGVAAAICQGYENCELISLDQNRGYSGGMTAGINHAAASRLLLVTHEARLERNCVEQLMEAMDDRPNLVLAGPALTRGSGGPVWSLGGKFGRLATVQHIVEPGDQSEIKWLDGACLLVKTPALREIGGLDVDYFLYWEDVDLSTRLGEVGEIDCVRSAFASQETSLAPTYFKSRNQILFWRKRHRGHKVAQAIFVTLAKMLFRDLPSGNFRATRARAAAVRDGLSGEITLKYNDVRVQ